MGRLMVPKSSFISPQTKTKYFFDIALSWNCFLRDAKPLSVLAMTIAPEVSLSSLWTIPGRRMTEPSGAFMVSPTFLLAGYFFSTQSVRKGPA
jgi:hypothetical protein